MDGAQVYDKRLRALIHGYEQPRPLAPPEKAQFANAFRYAALTGAAWMLCQLAKNDDNGSCEAFVSDYLRGQFETPEFEI